MSFKYNKAKYLDESVGLAVLRVVVETAWRLGRGDRPAHIVVDVLVHGWCDRARHRASRVIVRTGV